MPNHTRNEFVLLEGEPEEFEKLIFNPETRCIDFNVLVPRPSILDKVISPVRFGPNNRFMLNPTPEKFDAPAVEATEEEEAEILATGHTDWYTWSINNWGTKWNAYGTDPEDYSFNTAWDAPRAWLDALARKLPKGMKVQCISIFECGSPAEIITMEGQS